MIKSISGLFKNYQDIIIQTGCRQIFLQFSISISESSPLPCVTFDLTFL